METTLLRNSNSSTSFGVAGNLMEVGLKIIGVLQNNFQYTSEVSNFECIRDEESLTKMSMFISEKSLKEDWENENDEYWESYLK